MTDPNENWRHKVVQTTSVPAVDLTRLVRQSCNHIWREGPSCAPLKSKDALMTAIVGSKSSGRWLRGEELEWGKELEAEGKVTLCCEGKAATSLPNAIGEARAKSATSPHDQTL